MSPVRLHLDRPCKAGTHPRGVQRCRTTHPDARGAQEHRAGTLLGPDPVPLRLIHQRAVFGGREGEWRCHRDRSRHGGYGTGADRLQRFAHHHLRAPGWRRPVQIAGGAAEPDRSTQLNRFWTKPDCGHRAGDQLGQLRAGSDRPETHIERI